MTLYDKTFREFKWNYPDKILFKNRIDLMPLWPLTTKSYQIFLESKIWIVVQIRRYPLWALLRNSHEEIWWKTLLSSAQKCLSAWGQYIMMACALDDLFVGFKSDSIPPWEMSHVNGKTQNKYSHSATHLYVRTSHCNSIISTAGVLQIPSLIHSWSFYLS